MRSWIAGLLVFSIAPFPLAAIAQEPVAETILRDTLMRYVRPSYVELERRAHELASVTADLCHAPSENKLEKARGEFRHVVLAWSQIEWLRTGPAMAENRLERFLFYPDRKGIGLRQVQRALAEKPPDVTDPAGLAQTSVAMQGLPAYEFLVFGSSSNDLVSGADAFRCAYASAVAANLTRIAMELAQGWQDDTPLAQAFLGPGDGNPLFRDDREALNFILGTMIHGLEAIRDIRIGTFLREPGQDRPQSAIFRRAGLTMEAIAAGLEGLERLFNLSGFERALPADYTPLADQVRLEFRQSIQTAGSLEGDLAELVADETARGKLAYLQLAIGFAIQRLDAEIAPAAGLAAGFSFGDGD